MKTIYTVLRLPKGDVLGAFKDKESAKHFAYQAAQKIVNNHYSYSKSIDIRQADDNDFVIADSFDNFWSETLEYVNIQEVKLS